VTDITKKEYHATATTWKGSLTVRGETKRRNKKKLMLVNPQKGEWQLTMYSREKGGAMR
jgi:hypothetical protein